MSFYQACYTRIGKQERNAGWSVIASTEGLSKIALEHFKAIASDIIQQRSLHKELPAEIFLIQEDKWFVYICNIVLDCVGSDGRGNTFVHGYIVTKREYYCRCQNPASVLGLAETEFIKGTNDLTDDSLKSLPKKDILSYHNWNRKILLEKYGLSDKYSELMLCVFSALERRTSLCIRLGKQKLNMLREISRELLFCIMDGLPQILRPELTCSSFDIGNGTVFFSVDRTEKDQDFFDLETGVWSCSLECVNRYSFIRMLVENTSENQPWKLTERFFDVVFSKKGCSNVTANMIENVYRFYCGDKPENARACLYEMVDAGPSICPLLYQFFSQLLLWIDVKQLDESMQRKLLYLYKKNENGDFAAILEQQMDICKDESIGATDIQKDNHMKKLFGGIKSFHQIMRRLMEKR